MTVTPQTPHGLGRHGEHLSIMVPTYNCAHLLGETLRSLQVQGDRLRDAEIVVIDDCSTKDDPEAAVRAVWGDRVTFWRQPKNVGATRNFNTCLERAQRRWIYVLHGDDVCLEGAVEEVDRCLTESPDAEAVFGRAVFMDKDGIWLGPSDIHGSGVRGRYQLNIAAWAHNPLQFSGVMISKRAIERVGGFDESFGHVADWNLWWRIASSSTVAYTNRCLGGYRMFEGNHSSTLRRTAIDAIERLEQTRRMAATITERGSIDKLFYELFTSVIGRGEQYLRQRDDEAVKAHLTLIGEIGKSARIPRRVRLRTAWLQLLQASRSLSYRDRAHA